MPPFACFYSFECPPCIAAVRVHVPFLLFDSPSKRSRLDTGIDCNTPVRPTKPRPTNRKSDNTVTTMDLLSRFKKHNAQRAGKISSLTSNNEQQGQWKDPASLYAGYRSTDDNDDSYEDDNDSNSGSGSKHNWRDLSHDDADADDEASIQSIDASMDLSMSVDMHMHTCMNMQSSVDTGSSVLVGELAFENMSLVYSEDGTNNGTSRGGGGGHGSVRVLDTGSCCTASNISALSSQRSVGMDSTGSGSNLHMLMNVNKNGAAETSSTSINLLLLQDRHESDADDSCCISEVSSFYSPDLYFQPEQELGDMLDLDDNHNSFEQEPSETSNASDDYIFTDDGSRSPPVDRLLTEAESAALAISSSFIMQQQLEDEEAQEEKKQDHSDFIQSPSTWSSYNVARGRKAAKALLHLQHLRDTKNSNNISNSSSTHLVVADDTDTTTTEDGTVTTKQTQTTTSTTTKRSSSLLGRAVQSLRRKRYTPSSSPLDKQRVKKNVGSLLSSKTTNTSTTFLTLPPMSPSAVYARNTLVDFGSWEARVSAPTITTTSTADAEVHAVAVSEKLQERKQAKNPFCKNPCAVVEPVVVVKVTKLFLSDVTIPGFSRNEKDDDDNNKALESRTLADDMLQSLGLAGDDHARHCLQTLRARAGVIDDLESLCDPDADENDPHKDNVLPWMHIEGDLWMPHYEEYVLQTVHAFHRRLLVSCCEI
jgi:hypothetical protein